MVESANFQPWDVRVDDGGITHIRLAMACACGDKRQEWDDVLTQVESKLGCDSKYFVSRVVFDLSLNFDASIEGLWADQWFGMYAESMGKENPVRVHIECDTVEHGIAAIWLWLSALRELIGPWTGEDDDDDG